VQGNFALTGSISGAGTLNFGGSDSASGFYNISGTDLSSFTGTISHNNVNGTHQLIMGQNGTVNAAQASLETTGSTTAGNYIRLFSNTTFGELSGTGGRIIGRNTLTINQSNDTTYAGRMSSIQSGLSFTKAGSGSLTLTGANNYTGTTTVNNGTLVIDGDQSGATGSMTINVSGTLGGSGTIGASLLTVNGVIAPGNSPGTLTTGAQLWNDGGAYLWEINDSDGSKGLSLGGTNGWDWLDIDGDLNLASLSAGGFTIDIDSLNSSDLTGTADGFDYSGLAYGDAYGTTFIIATADTITDFEAGDFILDDSGFVNGKLEWSINLDDGVADSLVLSAVFVPEPSSTALLGLGGLALMLRRKRS
jgi:fibronectin-binding autotransporter adhesin